MVSAQAFGHTSIHTPPITPLHPHGCIHTGRRERDLRLARSPPREIVEIASRPLEVPQLQRLRELRSEIGVLD